LVADPMEFLFIIIPADVDQRSAHMTGRAELKDLVHADMWFLIAGKQITQAKNHVNQSRLINIGITLAICPTSCNALV
jgi:hypothetical protein